jgi:hypothetical protein
MSKRTPFLLRLPPQVMLALKELAAAEHRSINHQIEFILREAMIRAKRLSAYDYPTSAAEIESGQEAQTRVSEEPEVMSQEQGPAGPAQS